MGEIRFPEDLGWTPATQKGEASCCDVCTMWLNGTPQFNDHLMGRKHRNNLRKMRGKAEVEAALRSMALCIASKYLKEQKYRDSEIHIKICKCIAAKVLGERQLIGQKLHHEESVG